MGETRPMGEPAPNAVLCGGDRPQRGFIERLLRGYNGGTRPQRGFIRRLLRGYNGGTRPQRGFIRRLLRGYWDIYITIMMS